MRKQILYSLAMVLVLASITGCVGLYEPRVFDVPESRWNTLSEEQRQEVIRGYNERKNTEAQVEPLNRAVDVVGGYMGTDHRRRNTYIPVTRTRTRYVPVPVVRETTVVSAPSISHRPIHVYKKTTAVKRKKVGKVYRHNINKPKKTVVRRSSAVPSRVVRPTKNVVRKKARVARATAPKRSVVRRSSSNVAKKRIVRKKRSSVVPSQGVSPVENVWEKEARLSRATSPAR